MPNKNLDVTNKPPKQARSCVANFDDLPNGAFLGLDDVCSLFSCSAATIWRRVKSGQLVKPYRIGARTTRWNVGELRQAIASVMKQNN